MKPVISILPYKTAEADIYFQLFSTLIRSQFPEYSVLTREYFINSKREFNREYWNDYSHKTYKYIYGAWTNKKLVGLIHARLDIGGIGACSWLMIDPAYQKQGIGSSLLKMWESDMFKKGVHCLSLWCKDVNVKYYEKNGFTHQTKIKKMWFGCDINMMLKYLQEPNEKFFLHDEF